MNVFGVLKVCGMISEEKDMELKWGWTSMCDTTQHKMSDEP